MGMVFSVDEVGSVTGQHRDEFPLTFLGKAEIERASEIVFNSATQSWDVVLPGGEAPVHPAVTGFGGYEDARKFEAQWLDACLYDGVRPDSVDGIRIASSLRRGMQGYEDL